MLRSCTSCKPQASFFDKRYNIVFLDIDGVLHPLGDNNLPLYATLQDLVARNDSDLNCDDTDPNYMSPPVKGEFMEKNMSALRHLMQVIRPSAIVLSSTWRTRAYSVRAIEKRLKEHGICAPVVGCTPVMDSTLCNREDEICSYLRDHQSSIKSYCILDDMKLTQSRNGNTVGPFDPHRFVKCDPNKGLTMDEVEIAISILRGV